MFNFTDNQAAAINTLNCNVSVSAGAGSGKTRVLVERFINILAQGKNNPQRAVMPKEILAITFTRKAAAEMKERIRKRLYELEKEEPLNKEFWHLHRQGFDQARISTIHGFCNAILKENPVELALDPSFTVAEENDMQEFLESCTIAFIKKMLTEHNADAETLIRTYGIENVKKQLLMLYVKADEIFNFGDITLPYNVDMQQAGTVQAALLDAIDRLTGCLDIVSKTTNHWLQLKDLHENQQLVAAAARNYTAPGSFAVLAKYIDSMNKSCKEDKLIVAEAQELVRALKQICIDRRAQELAASWQTLLQDYIQYIKEKQEAQNLIGFDDLESLALNLLKNSPEIRRKYQLNFKYIMVDEFQDTNERQREIVYLLCGDNKDVLSGSKLFIVGDPKQSIYRFRGADVNVFARMRRDIKAGGGKNIILDDNFRTVDKILDLCNETFPELLGLDDTKDVFFEALKANRTSTLLPEMLVIGYDPETAQEGVRQVEANCLAQKIKDLHNGGTPYGDMVILLRAMTNVACYEDTLKKAGIPCNVVDGKGFYGRQEIIDFINLLTVCADSRRDLELAGVMRSPYFAIDDEAITALFFKMQDNAGKYSSLWQVLQSGDYPAYLSAEVQTRLKSCAGILNSIYNAAAALPLTALLAYIKDKLALNALMAAQPGGEVKLANLKKLFSLAGEFCLNKQGGLREYLTNINRLRARGVREAAALTESAQEAVTIMTIHKSKGLEFPVVILPALDSAAASDKDGIRFNKDIGLGIKADLDGALYESSVFTRIKNLNSELDNAEKQRQFYVAVTRAKDRLILSGAAKTKRDNAWFKKLRDILQDYRGLKITGINADEILPPQEVKAAENSITLTPEITESIQSLAAYGKAWQQGFSASSLQQYFICPRSYYYHYVLQMPAAEPQLTGTGSLDARTFGIVIHQALEKYTGDAQKALMQAAYNNNVPLQSLHGAEQLLRGYLQSPLYPGLDVRQLHETGFNLPLLKEYGINAVCYGVIDNIIYNEDESLTIIDYKTGQVPDKMQVGYCYQLALYKMAAEQLYNRPVTKAELHYLRGCKRFVLPQSFNPQEIADTLKQIFAKKDEHDFACCTDYCHSCPYNYFCKKI